MDRQRATSNGATNARSVALECDVGGRSLFIPTSRVAHVVTYSVVGPLPLARPFVGGLGIVEGDVVCSLTVSARPRHGLEWVTGVLLDARPSVLRYVVEVSSVANLVDVELSSDPVDGVAPFVRRARRADGMLAGWLDVDALLRVASTAIEGI